MHLSTPLEQWIDEVSRKTRPRKIVWCDGSQAERARIMETLLAEGQTLPLNEKSYPDCILYRSDPSDVARTEHLTYICSRTREEAGPTNNWMAPAEAKETVGKLFDGVMSARTMYVVPYLMGAPNSPMARAGVEVTDSPYVVASMGIMARIGKAALDQIGDGNDFVPGLHSLGDLSPKRRFILHFPEEKLIWSIGSGYGGNALLGKKCFSLRIASCLAREEGWLAEHMLILGLEDPSGKVTYMAAAFPSACGKTNLAMMQPTLPGWKVTCIGDDIAWIRVGKDGRLYAVNPESGFFGVAPGTSVHTNPNAVATIAANCIFTNVALTPDGDVWWEDSGLPTPPKAMDWQGNEWTPGSGRKAAHPNARFTAPAAQCPVIDPDWQNPEGVPLSAILFGGRRPHTIPLASEAFDWEHGVFMGSSCGSETTAAALGQAGVLRRDPFAMLPFCGYNMGDYFSHWLSFGQKTDRSKLPKVYFVNWFRKDDTGKWLWPGFGENSRVLKWIAERVDGNGKAQKTAIGNLPTADALDLSGLNLTPRDVDTLTAVDLTGWKKEVEDIAANYAKYDSHLPAALNQQLDRLRQGLQTAAAK
jgi:phosphoenolpyruvate carboxykinase (GTP)